MPLTLAYKFVAFAVMLAEINYCGNKLPIKEHLPIKAGDRFSANVGDPLILNSFAGKIQTKNYSYSFADSGRLDFIVKLDSVGRQSMGIDRREDESWGDCYERLTHFKTNVSSNDAYRLATNWLIAIEVDVKRLEENFPPVIKQAEGRVSPGGSVPIPLYEIYWGKSAGDPEVDVSISGIDGELLNVRQENDTYSKRPASLIKDLDKLLAIPDEEFLKYSDSERSNLVVRFAAVQYPVPNTSVVTTNEVPQVLQPPVSTATQDHNEPAKSQ